MKKIGILFLLLFTCFVTFSQKVTSQNQEWIISSSIINFKIKNSGLTVDGNFGSLSAKIIFDAEKSYGNSIEATIESKFVDTGNEKRDRHLKKSDYFDVATFPVISLKASVFSKQKDGSFKGYFKLTMKGKTKDVMIPFTVTEKDKKTVLKGEFKINRLDFGVGESSMILANTVALSIETILTKK